MILYIKENTNFWQSAEPSCFSSERSNILNNKIPLQHNDKLLTAGGSVGQCGPGFSTAELINFNFLTFCHKHKTRLLDTTNFSRHC